MDIVITEATLSDLRHIVAVWKHAELTRPWNNPAEDAERALRGNSSTIMIAKLNDNVIGTVVAGYDGHRGWVYYLAVDAKHQGNRLGVKLYTTAENWLKQQGAPKIQVLIRADNDAVVSFYEYLGFGTSSSKLMGKKLETGK